jgi:hypothetical protein
MSTSGFVCTRHHHHHIRQRRGNSSSYEEAGSADEAFVTWVDCLGGVCDIHRATTVGTATTTATSYPFFFFVVVDKARQETSKT